MTSGLRARSLAKPAPRANRKFGRGRTVLALEPLEERLALNNRFVVPLDVPADTVTTFHGLAIALITPGLASGDIIEIKQGAEPGGFQNANLPNVTNLTIRGEAGAGPNELAEVTLGDTVNITAARQGFSLQNLNLVFSGSLNLQANASLLGNRITLSNPAIGSAINVTATSAVIANNQIVNSFSATAIALAATSPSQTLISGNVMSQSQAARFIAVGSTAASNDIVRDNIFIGAEGNSTTQMIAVAATVNGLTIQHNTFRDADGAVAGIDIQSGAQNIRVQQNTFDLPGMLAASAAISNLSGATTGTTSLTISGNIINVGPLGTGILINAQTPTSRALVQANDILAGALGIRLSAIAAGTFTNIDLGGGTEGSTGGNNFRVHKTAASGAGSGSGAIVVIAGAGTVQAQNNLFSSIGPAAANLDNADNASLATVVTTGNLTGNAAFVQALFVRFLFRTGNVNNPADAGAFVNQLNAGGNPVNVVNAISRSPEAMGFVVDDLFHSILNRDADPVGRQTWINQLVAGATLESVKAGFFASVEYTARFAGERAFVTSLYASVLNRTGGDAEYQAWIALIPTLGRAGIAIAILNSAEAHGQSAARLYLSILKRPAGPAEIAAWANSGFDELAIRTNIAASAEGQGII